MNKEQQLIYNELVSKYNFNKEQKFQIEVGLQKNLDVSWYAKPEYHWLKMQIIRMGLEKGLSVSIYAKPDYNAFQMEQLRLGLLNDIKVDFYLNPTINWKEMQRIRLELDRKKSC